jgi:hypothetical protein
MELLRENLASAIEQLQLPFDAASIDVCGAVEFLTLRQDRRQQIDTGYSGPHYIFLPCDDDRVFVDYAYIWDRLYHLFYGVSVPDQNFKSRILEQFTHQGQSALPTTQLKATDGTARQIDAAFAVGDILVVAECRAVARSIGVDKGQFQALEKRRDVVETALNDIDEKAHWLAAHRKGSNYDVTGYRVVLPVGVTPFVEFIPSLSPRYWITAELPRVLTPAELLDALKDGSIKSAGASTVSAVHLS